MRSAAAGELRSIFRTTLIVGAAGIFPALIIKLVGRLAAPESGIARFSENAPFLLLGLLCMMPVPGLGFLFRAFRAAGANQSIWSCLEPDLMAEGWQRTGGAGAMREFRRAVGETDLQLRITIDPRFGSMRWRLRADSASDGLLYLGMARPVPLPDWWLQSSSLIVESAPRWIVRGDPAGARLLSGSGVIESATRLLRSGSGDHAALQVDPDGVCFSILNRNREEKPAHEMVTDFLDVVERINHSESGQD